MSSKCQKQRRRDLRLRRLISIRVETRFNPEGDSQTIVNRVQSDPDTLLASMVRDNAPEVEGHQEGHIPGGRANVDQGTADRARRSVQSNILAVVRSLAANHNRARRNAKPAGSLRVAQYQPSGSVVAECHTGKAPWAGSELVRRGTAGKPLGLER